MCAHLVDSGKYNLNRHDRLRENCFLIIKSNIIRLYSQGNCYTAIRELEVYLKYVGIPVAIKLVQVLPMEV